MRRRRNVSSAHFHTFDHLSNHTAGQEARLSDCWFWGERHISFHHFWTALLRECILVFEHRKKFCSPHHHSTVFLPAGSPSASNILGMSRYFSATSKAVFRLVIGSSCKQQKQQTVNTFRLEALIVEDVKTQMMKNSCYPFCCLLKQFTFSRSTEKNLQLFQ